LKIVAEETLAVASGGAFLSCAATGAGWAEGNIFIELHIKN